MSDDQMRQAFELFYALNFDECDVFMQKQWEAAWKASRAALVIDLDSAQVNLHDGGSYLDSCKVADLLEAAGVTVKP